MDIEFMGTALSDGRAIISNCILQGIKACKNRIYLKDGDKLGWTEVDPLTVKQTKHDDNNRGDKERRREDLEDC